MKTTFIDEFVKSAKEAPRIYFAPVIGAIKEVRAEFRRISAKSTHPSEQKQSGS